MLSTKRIISKHNICPVLLAIIAAAVCVGQLMKQNMWALIVVYWAVLTAKNTADATHRDQ